MVDSFKIYCYLRVSTEQQDIKSNKDELILKVVELGLNPQNIIWIEEIISGCTKDWTKRKLGEISKDFNKGDYFITSEISRISRIYNQVLKFMIFASETGINVYFTKQNFKVDSSIGSLSMVHSFSICAQMERDLISQRTRDALQRKKREGVILGRPKDKCVLDPFKDDIKKLLDQGVKHKHIALKYKVSNPTFSKFVNKNKLK